MKKIKSKLEAYINVRKPLARAGQQFADRKKAQNKRACRGRYNYSD